MSGYVQDRQWSDRFIPHIKCIVGPRLMAESSFDVDTKQATDLIILRARNMMVAARVRRPGYFSRYPHEFTIRSDRDSGAETELQKVVNGFGDWMFYGHADETERHIAHWHLIDLHAWRAHMIRDGQREKRQLVHGKKSNGDGTHFQWFDIASFRGEPSILVASSETALQVAA